MSVIESYIIGIVIDELSCVSSVTKVMLVLSIKSIETLSLGIGTKCSFHHTDGHTFIGGDMSWHGHMLDGWLDILCFNLHFLPPVLQLRVCHLRKPS